MLARQVARRSVCLSRASQCALFRTTAVISKEDSVVEGAYQRKGVNVSEPVDPTLVEPVLKWLADDAAEKPFIPVQAQFSSKAPSFLPLTPFCGYCKKDSLVHLDPSVFHHPIRQDILHKNVVHYLASRRSGTASTKTRGEVSYSSKKIRPQKGSGRARLGDRGSPMLRGGGRAFGPKPRDFSIELPRKVKEMGLRVALSAKVRERRLFVVPSVDWPNAKTKFIAGRLKGMTEDEDLIKRGVLILTGEKEVPEKLERTTRNLAFATVMSVQTVGVWDILRRGYCVLELSAVKWLQDHLGMQNRRPELDLSRLVGPSSTSSISSASQA